MKPSEVAESNLPGAELVSKGLYDLEAGIVSEESLLVMVASPRLKSLGIDVPVLSEISLPYEHALYSLLEDTHGADAYSRYNSLVRRIVSFSRALEREVGARIRKGVQP
jgi:hypothetical protein